MNDNLLTFLQPICSKALKLQFLVRDVIFYMGEISSMMIVHSYHDQ